MQVLTEQARNRSHGVYYSVQFEPQTGWFKQWKFLPVLETRSSRSKCHHGWFLVKPVFLVSRWWPSWRREISLFLLFLIAKSLQSCLTLCDPIDGSPPGPTVPGILQARTLEWVAISFSNAWKWKVKVESLSRVRPSATPWTAAFQAPPSMGFSRQEYWSGVPLPSPPSSSYKDTNPIRSGPS